jgi:tetratricopeptide (TPR) repeat protein
MADAEEIARDAMTIRIKVLGVAHPSTANSYNNVAGLLMEQERYEEAEPLMRKALTYTEQSLGAWHALTANRQHNLATLLDETGQDDEAVKMYSKAMNTRDKKLGPDHPETLGSASSLAGVYLKTGRYLDSLQLYRRCVAAHRQHVRTSGGNAAREALLTNMTELAMALHKTGHHDEALQNVEEASKLATILRGPGSEEMTMFADMKESLQSHAKAAGARRGRPSLMPQGSYRRMASVAKSSAAMSPVPPAGSAGDSPRLVSFASRRAV